MRTVFSVDPFAMTSAGADAMRMALRVLRCPFRVDGADVTQLFTIADQPEWGTPNAVQVRGQLVRDALRMHKGVSEVLDSLARTAESQVQPIFVKLTRGEAELITWEALCDMKDKFVALDTRWPIGRIADPTYCGARPPTVLGKPFKILAVISAFEVRQVEQWQFIENAVRFARSDGGLDVRIRVLTADELTRATIDATIRNGDSWIEVSHMESTGARVVSDIIAWDPNVLHFFCHGAVSKGGQSLQLARASDYLNRAATTGSIEITTEQLTDMSEQLSNPWLLVLNCCRSSAAAEDLRSMTFQCVSTKFPAAVGMVEPVDAMDAHEFTRALYSEFLRKLRSVATALQSTPSTYFEWAQVMHAARAAIISGRKDSPTNFHQWVLPALYVRGIEPMLIERLDNTSVDDSASHRLRAAVVAEWAQRQYDLDAEHRRRVIAAALADVPRQLWPAADGSFPVTGR